MRHLITFALFAAAAVTYIAGIGPLFFGAPLIGIVLVGAGLVLESVFWFRVLESRK